MPSIPQTNASSKLKSYPDISQICLQQRLDLPYRLWLLLRPANDGRGWLTLDQVYHLSCGSRRQTRSWLRKGQGVFWTRDDQGRVFLAGLGTLAKRLGTKLPRAPVYVNVKDIEGLASFRAALFSSWFVDAGDEGRIISQAALSDLFGKTDRTLRNWAKSTNMVVTGNLGQAPIPKPGDDLDRYPTGTLETLGWGKTWLDKPGQKVNLVWYERLGNETVLTWKIPSSYVSTLTAGPKTTLQKRASRNAPGLCAAGANARRYYSKDAKGVTLARAIQSGGPVYLATGIEHPNTGERLWTRLA